MNQKIKSAEMWDQRFGSPEYLYGKQPNDFLKSNYKLIPNGKVLCIGEGEGRNSVFLARQGYQVTALDYSVAGLNKTETLAKENHVEIELIHADLTTYDSSDNVWQGIVSIFCHIHKNLRHVVHQNCFNSLKEGGFFLLEGYSPNQLKYNTGGPKDLDLLMDLKEVKNELKGLDFQISHEIIREIYEGSIHKGLSSVIQIIGKKVD
jgi:SAM-dependent methyltransferase